MSFVRTASGTFHDGDLVLNQKGLRLISEENESRVRFSLPYFIYSLVCFQLLIFLDYKNLLPFAGFGMY